LASDPEGVEANLGPPLRLISCPVKLAVMQAAERDGELVTHFAAECRKLCESQVMGIAGLAPADQTGSGGDEFQVRLVAIASRLADRQ